ncbi:MAG: hypothetical protein QOJ53_2331 [Sphingomonadales bacterium]|jgi:hypothetical protein|nr:hypothetical protein [Sphingomonadales bacterium]
MTRLQALAAALLALLPVPAAAQSIPPEERPIDARRRAQHAPAAAPVTRADLIRGVACQLGADAASLEPMLATAPYSEAEGAQAARILPLVQECIGLRASLAGLAPALRGAIAEAFYESRFATPQPARSPEPGVKPLLVVEAATARPDAATLAPAYAMAHCTAARNGAEIRALLATDPNTPEEQTAFAALNPAFGRCAAGGGAITIDSRTLRGVLAESLYRWSIVQRDGAASPLAAAPAGN